MVRDNKPSLKKEDEWTVIIWKEDILIYYQGNPNEKNIRFTPVRMAYI